ncbi:unnamed protein product, partial [Scytosiphon promiscuus]
HRRPLCPSRCSFPKTKLSWRPRRGPGACLRSLPLLALPFLLRFQLFLCLLLLRRRFTLVWTRRAPVMRRKRRPIKRQLALSSRSRRSLLCRCRRHVKRLNLRRWHCHR